VRWAVARENEVERSVVGYNVTVSFERIWWKIVKRVCPICGDSKKAFLQYVTCSIPRLQCRKIYLIEQLISRDIFKVPRPHFAILPRKNNCSAKELV
jgi:hypothetical protein